jgi:O-antigen/teichoic acid export membrane protein
MIKVLVLSVKNFFSKGHERTVLAKKNIIASLLVKGGSILVGLALVPLTIHYVNATQYGIWLTLSSLIGWFSFFDVGLGNGLKNKLAEANALGNIEDGRKYVSTSYAMLIIISAAILAIFLLINPFLNWQKILNTTDSGIVELRQLVLLMVSFFSLQFVVQTINTVLTANHAPARASLITLIGQLVSIVIIYFLTRTTEGSLLYLVLVLAGVPPIVMFLAGWWLYRNGYKMFAPSLKLVEFKYARGLLSLGATFFVIQLGVLMLFQTDNIVTTQLYGPKQVTTFNVAYRLFSTIIMGFTIIMTPFWAAFTDAYAKDDIGWIKNIMANMEKLWLGICVGTLFLLFASPYIFKFWLGDAVKVPFMLSVAMSIYVMVYTWQTIHVFILNGIGKVRLQLYLVVISSCVNIPLAIFLGKYFSLAGITIANAFLFLLMGIVFSIQCKKILNHTATKIWNK